MWKFFDTRMCESNVVEQAMIDKRNFSIQSCFKHFVDKYLTLWALESFHAFFVLFHVVVAVVVDNVCSHLDHVFLHTGGVWAAEDGEQFVVRDEEESGEGVPLAVQVVVQTLLAPLQTLAQHLQVLQPVVGMARVLDLRVGHRVRHYLQNKPTKIRKVFKTQNMWTVELLGMDVWLKNSNKPETAQVGAQLKVQKI